MSATCSLICSRRNAGVVGKVAIWSRARVSCATASTNSERASDRCPALPHRSAAFSISPASVSDAPADPAGSRRSPGTGTRWFRRCRPAVRAAALAAACHKPRPAPEHA